MQSPNIRKEKAAKQLGFGKHNIYYEVRGDSTKTLIFIHGWTSSIKSWKFQLDSFPSYKVIAIDLPGHGKSSKDEKADYSMELFADSIVAVMRQEKIEKAFFFGHSMGFSVAEVLSQKYPDLCAGIGSIDGTHFEVPNDEQSRKEWLEYTKSFTDSLKEEKGRDDFINALFLPDTPEMLRKEIFETSRQVPLSIGISMSKVEKDIKWWTERKIDIPCLAIHSQIFHTKDYEKDFKKMYPNVEYHNIDNTSHFLMLEMPYRINQMISDYLKRNY